MATQLLTVVKFQAKSGIPKDAVQHSWHFQVAIDDNSARNAVVTLLKNFYTVTAGTATNPVGFYLSSVLSRTVNPRVIFYDVSLALSGGRHGSPVADLDLGAALPAPSGTNLPSELAVCMSYHSDYGVDVEFGVGSRPRARDRGRVFLGPLQASAQSNDATTQRALVSNTMRNDIAQAAGPLLASVDPQWSVWSRKASAFKPVTGGWVDDAFDVQRRRGEASVARTAF